MVPLSEDQIAKLFHYYVNYPNPDNALWAIIASDVGSNIQQVYLFYRNQARLERGDVQEEEPSEHVEEEERNEHVQKEEPNEHAQNEEPKEDAPEEERQSNGSEAYDEEEEEELRYKTISSLSKKELSDLYDTFEEDDSPFRRTICEIASKFGLNPEEVHAWFHRTRDEYALGRRRVQMNEREVDTQEQMEPSDSQQAGSSKKPVLRRVRYGYTSPIRKEVDTQLQQQTVASDSQQAGTSTQRLSRRVAYRHTSPIRRSPNPRKIGELSDTEFDRLFSRLSQTPNPTNSDFERIAQDMSLSVDEIETFYVLQLSTGTENQAEVPNVRTEDVSESGDNGENVLEREEAPMNLSKLELARLREIFKKNPNPSADLLRKLAADFEVHEGELRGWFHTERIKISHREVMEKKRAKRKLTKEPEKTEGSGPLEYHPPPKRVLAVPKYRHLLERQEKVSEHAELLKVKEQYQEKNQKCQNQSQLTEDQQMKENEELEKNEIEGEESKRDAEKDSDNAEFDE